MDCLFEINADGFWQCTHKGCGWIYPRKADKPPRRNCPKALTIMIAAFDRLLEIGDDDAADELGERLMCPNRHW